jgi:hypothetical protein
MLSVCREAANPSFKIFGLIRPGLNEKQVPFLNIFSIITANKSVKSR